MATKQGGELDGYTNKGNLRLRPDLGKAGRKQLPANPTIIFHMPTHHVAVRSLCPWKMICRFTLEPAFPVVVCRFWATTGRSYAMESCRGRKKGPSAQNEAATGPNGSL